MENPFPNAMEMASKALVQDPTLRFIYRDLPPGVGAGYMFPPANLILLPRIDVSLFSREQQIIYTALTYHELRHHALSDGDEVKRSCSKSKEIPEGKGNPLVKHLSNTIEDARIELSPHHIFRGGKQDLTRYRIDKYKETCENAVKTEEGQLLPNYLIDRWGFLSINIVFFTQKYGSFPIHPSMKKYWDIVEKIITDGRFEKSCKMHKEGHTISTNLAFEIAKKWQEERSKEYKEDHDGERNDSKSSDSDNRGEGLGKNGTEESSNGTPSETGGGNDPEKHESNVGNSDRKHNKGNGTSKNGENSGCSINSDRDDDSSDAEKYGGDPESRDTSDIERNAGIGKPRDTNDKEIDANKNKRDRSGNDGDNSDRQEREKKHDLSRPKSVVEEFDDNNENSLQNDPNAVGKEVAEMGKEGDPNDFQLNWWADTDKRDPHGDYYTHGPENKRGDDYIPFLSQDREIVASPHPVQFHKIEKAIGDKVSRLRNELSIILRMTSMSRVERFQKRGTIDPRAFYKIPQGSKHVKKRLTPGIRVNAAVSLLIDLSGSMCGSKAELAAQIATLFGEALVSIPEIPYEIRGYNSSPLVDDGFVYRGQSIASGATRRERVNHWVFKRFNENWKNVRTRMGACACSMINDNETQGGATGGCNIDHENLIFAAHHLSNRKEQRKIMIVLCDGAPSGYNGTYGGLLESELCKAIQRVKKSGIKLFCFGMMAERVKEFYSPDVEIVHSLEDLDQKALKKLAEYLLHK